MTDQDVQRAAAAIDLEDAAPGAVTDQGERPTCLAVATSVAHQVARWTGSSYPALAPDALWSAMLAAGHADANGSTAIGAHLALSTDGQPTLEDWPYDPGLAPGDEPQRPVGCPSAPWDRGELRPVGLAFDGKEDAVVDVLRAGRAVVLIMETSDAFSFPGDHGLVLDPGSGQGDGGFHAVAVWGAFATASGEMFLRIRNSWGEDWGDGGFCWLPATYLNHYGHSAFEVNAA